MRYRGLFAHSAPVIVSISLVTLAAAADLYNDAEARSSALGGEEVAAGESVLAAMNSNPAALSSLDRPAAAVTVTGAILNGKFVQSGRSNPLHDSNGVIASAALAIPLPGRWPVRIGLAVIPDLTLESNWTYPDQLGGLGGATSYGLQSYHSRILSLRSMLGASLEVTPWLSLGASAGVVYGQDELTAPYIFQSQRILAGFKTLLKLETDGYAPTFDFGVQFRPLSTLTVGLSYRPPVELSAHGRATGNAKAQLVALGGGFIQARPDFGYDAEVETELPQRAAIGAEWQVDPRFRLVAGIDWLGWSSAFDQLHIHLTNGNNADINGVAGSSSLTDVAPLHWRDQFIYRTGVEFAVNDKLEVRVGYSYGRSPVPNETLAPLNAAIFEHAVSAGLGYSWGRYRADLSYQWRLPAVQRVDQSLLLAGEYSHSSIALSAHVLQLSTGVEF